MPQTAKRFATCDPVWASIREEAVTMAEAEPVLASFLHATVLNHEHFEQALSYHLAQKLGSMEVPSMLLRQVFDEALLERNRLGEAVRADLVAVRDRDPACTSFLQPFLHYKGFQALQAYRVSHWLWNKGREAMALFLQSRVSEAFAVDIHPAARIGHGIMIDHATGIVIGETTVIGNNVSMLQGVTLGGTGKESGDRHPKVGDGVLLAAGASVLGNVTIGHCAKVGAGSVVLSDVPENCTVAGVPAKVVGCAGCDQPSREMDQRLPGDDPEDAPQP